MAVVGSPPRREGSLEASISRLLSAGTYVAVALIAVGTVLLLASGRSPLEAAPTLVLSEVPAQILARDPVGFLWLGILLVVATPGARVVAALVGYSRRGERPMVLVSALILLVVALGVIVGVRAG